MNLPYRFEFKIIDPATGDVIAEDYCPIGSIGAFGECESVDMHVASTLRWFERKGRKDHEAEAA